MMDLVARVIAEQVQLRVAQQSQAQSQQSQQSQQSRVFGGEAEVGDSQSVSGQQGAQFMFGMQGSQSVSGQQEGSGVSGLQAAGAGSHSQSQSVPSPIVAPTDDPIRGMLVEFISQSVAKKQLFEVFSIMFTEYGNAPAD